MTQEHSSLPWTMKQAPKPVDGAYDFAISSDNAPVLAEVFGRCAKGSFVNAEANAALIVKAVNRDSAFDDLVKALEAIFADVEACAEQGEIPVLKPGRIEWASLARARIILAKAKAVSA